MQNFQFANLMGTVYTKGNLQFSSDGSSVISPVGNRITLYDLKNQVCKTLSVESTTNFTCTSLSPNGFLLLAGNENGEVYVISLISESVIHILKPGGYIQQVKYSPDGSLFAVAKKDVALIYTAPMKKPVLNPFELRRSISDVKDIVDLDWSFDGRLIAVSCGTGVVQVYPTTAFSNFKAVNLAVNTEGVLRTFFIGKTYNMYCIDRNGVLRIWETQAPDTFQVYVEPTEEYRQDDVTIVPDVVAAANQEKDNRIAWIRYKQSSKFYYNDLFPKGEKRPPITSADFNLKHNMLVTGFEGTFFLHEMPDFNMVQTFKISNASISTISINCTGQWIAFGCPSIGQLLVWEWQSESYIMKQQGHYDIIDCFEFSPTSPVIATGGVDGKIKLWNQSSSFCYKTFGDHTGPITGLVFTQKGKAILSSSMDGTVRAYDLMRYRNFRTFLTPRQVQLRCLAVDSTGTLVIAGGLDVFEIFMWSINGQLLDVFAGHEGCVTAVAFSPSPLSSCFVSCSLDKQLRIWQSIESSGVSEKVQLDSEATCLAFSPVGNMIAVGCLNASITFFDLEGHDLGSINGGMYLHSMTLTSAGTKHQQTNKLRGKEFHSLSFSPDGKFLLAAGTNKIICMFNVEKQRLATSFIITKNRSLDGTTGFVNHRKMTEFGNLDLVEDRDDTSNKLPLPGARKGDMASRTYRNEVRVTCIRFASTGSSWAAATTEGVMVYSTKKFALFDPIGVDISVTPQAVANSIVKGEFDRALMMALQLNMPDLIKKVIGVVNVLTVEILVKDLPFKYARLLLQYMATELRKEVRLELYVRWIKHLLQHHLWVIQSSPDMRSIMNDLKQSVAEVERRTVSLVYQNSYTIEYLLSTINLENENAMDYDVKREVKISDSDEDEENIEKMDTSEPTVKNSNRSSTNDSLYKSHTTYRSLVPPDSDSDSDLDVNPFKISRLS